MSRRLLVLCLMLGVGCSKDEALQRERDTAIAAKEMAEVKAAEAVKDAREAMERVERIEQELGDLAKKLDEAIATLTAAQNDADRTAASAKLDQLRKEHAKLQQGAAAAKDAAKKAERLKATN